MRNLEAVQQGLTIVRDALTPLVERVLRDAYGDDWWQRGVLDALVQDQKPIHDRPAQGNAGDIDLQLALKLVQVYHWELFSDDLDWGGRQRSLLGAVTAVRNQYEGHVTPNREAELNDGKTRDLLEGMEMFVNLFDRKAGDRIGNLVELLKMQQPEPELPDQGETVILRRPVPDQAAQRPQKARRNGSFAPSRPGPNPRCETAPVRAPCPPRLSRYGNASNRCYGARRCGPIPPSPRKAPRQRPSPPASRTRRLPLPGPTPWAKSGKAIP